ncbi:hypothetical protein BU16DRAFT_541019 [Lophium mytilinum]|uniref:MARVEL domain-containing protein n=1 Tax=Lophium mytilinum TaxID=390894 RepID=A0A6A6QMU6_9PEZI|nr:hypothetical protein BU16DRAFT_541019 [Lophium mytilinum]
MAPAQTTSWKKTVLIPFWAVRIFLMTFIIGAYAWALAVIRSRHDIENVSLGVMILFMLLLVICLLLDILAIVMFGRNTLKPGVFLLFNVIQTTFWTVILVLDIVALARPGVNRVGILGSAIVFLSFLGLLIYALVIFVRDRKNRKRGHGESTTANPASVPLVQAQPQQYGYTQPLQYNPTTVPEPSRYHHPEPEMMPAPQYKSSYPTTAVELPVGSGESAEYYSGAPARAAHGPPAVNPFSDPQAPPPAKNPFE